MQPTSSVLGGFEPPLNQFAYIALVLEEAKPFRCVNVDRPSNRNPPRRRTVRILVCTDPHTLLIVGKRQPCSDEVPKKPRLLPRVSKQTGHGLCEQFAAR